ncbi:MAG: hypothetical protein HOW73_21815 [Polyangiaceae bacterium]|nr:hypothetical protein [Polyangiaceae bacterium]
MRVVIGGKRVRLDPRKVLGEGGEATVLLWAERGARRAVKLYKADAAQRLPKLSALVAVGPALDGIAVLPQAIVHDEATGAAIGFTMPALEPGFEPFALLSRESFCAAAGLDLARLLAAVHRLGYAVRRLHDAGIVVGDFNDQNELVRPSDGAVAFIDCDSFQLANLPCEVSTEAFLDPLLYGPDAAHPCATADGAPRWFGRGSDWYSFAVIAFRSLTGVHPYGGTDAAHPTLASRARAGRSVLSRGVVVPPKTRSRIEALSDSLLDGFARVFEAHDRRPFSLDDLRSASVGIRRCSCGLELAAGRRACPRCTAAGPVRAGRVSTETLASSDGGFFAVAADATRWSALSREGRDVVATIGSWGRGDSVRRVVAAAAGPDTLVRLAPVMAAVCTRSGDFATLVLVDLSSGVRVSESTTEVAMGAPAFELGDGCAYRIAKGTVIELRADVHGRVEEVPIGSVVSEQTVLHRAGRGVVAVTAVLGRRSYQWLGRSGNVELDVPSLDPGEALITEWIAAEGDLAIVLRHTLLGGVEHVRTTLLDRRGTRLRDRVEAASARRGGAALQGGVFSRGRVLVATDIGLVRHDPRTADAVPFADTEPHVVAECPLAAGPRGVLVALGSKLQLLSLA